MDKNAIKKYAVWARTELIERVTQKALQYGVSGKKIIDENADSINGKLLTEVEKKQRKALIGKINDKGFEQVMEEVAYTWFNRFSALRFMEVNGYLPSHVRVFTDDENNFKPQIISEAINLEIEGIDIDKVYSLKEENKNEELYKYLLIIQCNALNKILPGMFQRISDYTELLLPDNLLREGSVIQQMIAIIPEEDWKDAVQIIGWLYQYYNSVPKDIVFANLKKNIKIKKEDIPAATQLFTPDWIVRYMVENSLGRLWYEWHPDEALKSNWKYYLDEAKQESKVQAQLDKIREEYKGMKPEDIKCIDPCMGSGHILVYMFDVLMQIYESYGYNAREAVASILQNNLYGLDIDDRAAQLAYFAVMMKARQYDRRFFSREIQPHIYAIVESNKISSESIDYFTNGKPELKTMINTIVNEMYDAKEYGSILNITHVDFGALYTRFDEMQHEVSLFKQQAVAQLLPLINVAQSMAQKYDVVITNPPYMGASGMGPKLLEFVKKNYADTKADLFACFIEKGNGMIVKHGYNCMVTMQSWMFLSSFEVMRNSIVNTKTISNLMHMENMVMGIAFGTAVANFRNSNIKGYKGTYNHITMKDIGDYDLPVEFPVKSNRFAQVSAENFSQIPGSPIAYWISEKMLAKYSGHNLLLKDFASPRAGLATGDNTKFQRLWYEISYTNIGFNFSDTSETANVDYRWYPCNSGGDFRKWSTNDEYVVNWYNDGFEVKSFKNSSGKLASRPQNTQFYFKKGITWNKLSSSRFAVKFKKQGYIYDDTSRSAFIDNDNELYYLTGLLCSNVTFEYLKALNPTMSFTNGDLERIPYVYSEEQKNEIDALVEENISISKKDWDSFENSWDFITHPLIAYHCGAGYAHVPMEKWKYKIADAFRTWESNAEAQFNQLKTNEEELNRIFIEIYSLQDELTPEVKDKDVTVSKADLTRDIKSFISYAVGCMLGRYSLDIGGLAFAGGEWDERKYISYPADADNIIPICDDEYFEDDIVGRFIKFVETVYGRETLDENLNFIADALGGKGSPKEIIRNYFLNNFFADHCKTYQKRPIYWLFDSGKKNGFKCLIYMHRYQPDTIARIRTDYVHEQQARYRTAIADLEQRINGISTSERVKLNKQLTKLKDQESELRTYEEKIHHLADQMIPIDLDDGVKVNYAKFQDVLAKIK